MTPDAQRHATAIADEHRERARNLVRGSTEQIARGIGDAVAKERAFSDALARVAKAAIDWDAVEGACLIVDCVRADCRLSKAVRALTPDQVQEVERRMEERGR